MKKFISPIILFCLLASVSFAEQIQLPGVDSVGKIFDEPIPRGNYYFVLKVVSLFGTPWGGTPANQEQLEKRVQDDLLLSYEAFRRNIVPTREEVETEITKTLKGNKAEFDWKANKKTYEEWVQKNLGETVEVFENQMKHLVQLKKLQQQILDSIEPTVTDEEAYQEFLNEYNTLSIELVQFDDIKEAEKFYKQTKKSGKFWDKEKTKNPKKFQRPGFVALEFLMYMWQLPKKAVYDMIDMKVDSLYPPTPVYRGHGVFKILEIRKAKPEEYPRLKTSYFDQIKTQKKYDGFSKWLENLRKESNMKITIEPPQAVFEEKK